MVSFVRRKTARTRIGLDVGDAGLRVVQLMRAQDGYAVCSAAKLTRSPHRLAGDDTSPRRPQDIRSCVAKAGCRGRQVAAALNPPAVEYFPLEIPASVVASGDANMADVVRYEVGRCSDVAIDSIEARYWSLPTTSLSAPNAMALGARRELVDKVLDECSAAGLLCDTVDSGAAALARFGALLNAWEPDRVWGLLDLGSARTSLVLCLENVPVLVRQVGGGGHHWSERIAEVLQVSLPAAETHKCDYGIAMSGRRGRRRTDEPQGKNVGSILLGALRGELRDIAAQVKRSYEYVLSCYPNRRAGDLILVGGGAGMENLAAFLGDALGITVRGASAYLGGAGCRLTCDLGPRQLEQYAAAVGLAVDG